MGASCCSERKHPHFTRSTSSLSVAFSFSPELWKLPIADRCIVEGLLDGLKTHILPRLLDPEGKATVRVLISTPLPESAVAPYLTQLAAEAGPHDVKVGSYPRWGKARNTVTLVGKDQAYLDSIAPGVAQAVSGRVVQTEDEDDHLPVES